MKSLQALLFKQKSNNTMTLPSDFLRYGNRKIMTPDWTEVVMNDRDHYVGYGYGAITRRARKVAQTAIENVYTQAGEKEDYTHPYLEVITNSKTFSNYQFWSEISTYLDLEGVYYLMAIRAVEQARVGEVQEFKLLNTYNIRRILNPMTLEVEGYVEHRGGMVREIPKQLIIEMRELNPFNKDEPLAMTDAAKESQFTLKTAGDYTRHSLRNNINASGIVSTDVVLEEEQFRNFMERVKKHVKGEPIFGNGPGAVKFEDMQIALKDAALGEVRETNRDELLTTLGVSKTIMGIEQSGVTRETARVQKELNMEDQIIPRIQTILDALNQDYINFDSRYQKDKAILAVNNPLEADHDAELKETEVKQAQLDLYQSLVNKGVPLDLAAKYIKGEVEIEELKIEKMELPDPMDMPEDDEDEAPPQNRLKKNVNGLTNQQQGVLQNQIQAIESMIVTTVIKNIKKHVENAITKQSDLMSAVEETQIKGQMKITMADFYNVVMQFKGSETIRDRMGQYALSAQFVFDKVVRSYVRKTAGHVAESHVDVVTKELYNLAREASAQGLSQWQIQDKLLTAYSDISRTRAKAVARTETNRIFTRAQYEADRQFIEQNELEAFKIWTVRSDNPCENCLALEAEGPIPFEKNFREIGETVKSIDVSFEALEAGNLHPNCSCTYELVIK